MNISGFSGIAGLASTLQVPVPVKTPESGKDVKGADEQAGNNDQPEGHIVPNLFGAASGTVSKVADGAQESPLDSLKHLLEGRGFKPASNGEGQANLGPATEEKFTQNGIKTADNSQTSDSVHDRVEALGALLGRLFGGGQHSDTPPVPGAGEAHLSTSNVS